MAMQDNNEAIVHTGKRFEEVTYEDKHVVARNFTRCTFYKSNLKGCVFEDCSFIDCTFESCDLSLIKLKHTSINGVKIIDSKAIGIVWYDAGNPFAVGFTNSRISYCSFFGKSMKKAQFINCMANEVDFSECDLTQADFRGTDLSGATFANTDLTKANFAGARNYLIDTKTNKIKKAKFSLPEALSLLYGLDIIIEE